MLSDYLSTVDWSRAQFAMTAIYHWLFVPLTLGLGFLIAIMETLYVRTKDPFWLRTTKFWMRLFGINFAIGVATGLILEFEFGTNWSNYSHFVGDIFGAPLAIEGILAFFLESTFIAVMFFGWRKVSRGFHLTATWLTAFGANLSAWWILVANSWMQYPVGCDFNLETVRNEMTSFSAVALSPVAVNKFFHTVTSSFVLAALFVVGVSAWYLLRRREQQMARKSIAIASAFGFVFALITAFTGDRSGAIVARVQPMKLAAMEALYEGQEGAPLTAVGVLRPEAERTNDEDAFYFKIGIPKMLSLMSFRDADAFVPGIYDLVYGNEERGIMSAAEKIERGRTAVDELGRYRAAREAGDTAAIQVIQSKFDRSTPEGEAFLRDHFAYFGYGYLSGTHARDKDAVNAVLLICEAAAWYAKKGMTLGDAIDALYTEFGCYCNMQKSFAFTGETGMEKMAGLMQGLRKQPLREIAGLPVEGYTDYEAEGTGLPKANVLEYRLPGGDKVIIRPSGTEPKIKAYLSAVKPTVEESNAQLSLLAEAAAKLLA